MEKFAFVILILPVLVHVHCDVVLHACPSYLKVVCLAECCDIHLYFRVG